MVATRPHTPPRTSPLRALASLARELDDSLAAEADALAGRIDEGRFFVACVGQFKRGKSTLLNALVGGAPLPTGVVPVTSVVTIVRHGVEPRAVIHLRDRAPDEIPLEDLPRYVTERENPENAKGVTLAEVFVPSELLASGMCLVDTPGLGSVSLATSATTRAFVPHIDAAIVVLGADPPVSADELALVEDIARQTPELIFVLNKADRVSEAERREVRTFCERVIAARLGRPIGPLLEVSAVERLPESAPARDWAALVARLTRLASDAGGALVHAAEARGVEALTHRLRRELDERRAALQRPLDVSARRLEALERCATDAERALGDLSYLLTAEQERLHRQFAAKQDAFLASALPAARVVLCEGLRASPARGRAGLWRDAHRLAQETFRPLLDEWRREQQPVAAQLYRDAATRFVELANRFLERACAEGGLDAAQMPRVLGEERGFRATSRAYYTHLMYTTTRTPLRWLVDAVRPLPSFRAAVERDAVAYLDRLVATNAARITSDLDEQVRESRRRLEHDLRARLREICDVARRAWERARVQRQAGESATQTELARLAALDHALAGILRTAEVS